MNTVFQAEKEARTVLIVDDQDLNHYLLDKMFESETRKGQLVDFTITKVYFTSGASALEYLKNKENPCDLLITDFEMPNEDEKKNEKNLNGIDLIRAVRGNIRPDLPIILWSGSAEPKEMEQRAKKAGANEFFEKPLPEYDGFFKKVHDLLDGNVNRPFFTE